MKGMYSFQPKGIRERFYESLGTCKNCIQISHPSLPSLCLPFVSSPLSYPRWVLVGNSELLPLLFPS